MPHRSASSSRPRWNSDDNLSWRSVGVSGCYVAARRRLDSAGGQHIEIHEQGRIIDWGRVEGRDNGRARPMAGDGWAKVPPVR